MIECFLTLAMGVNAQLQQDTTPASSVDQGPVLSESDSELTFDFTPGVWLLRVRGKASNGPGNQPDLRLDTQLGLTDLITAFRGEAVISKGDWSVRIAGSTFDSSGSTTAEEFMEWGNIALSPGDDFTSTFDMSFMAAELQWELWNPLGKKTLTDEHPLRLGMGPHVGISWIDIDQTLTSGLQTVSNGSAWWSIWGGANLEFEFDMKRFVSWIDSIRVQAMAGLGATPIDGGLMWHAGGGAQIFFTPNFSASIEYRYEKYTLEDGDWNLTPNFQGLFLGGTIRF
ncbi:MAG: hypothetical protein MK089_11620 [Phycisphaerales bacterium]|nr:hypothetical protein [Phycisphaerales bacterium]